MNLFSKTNTEDNYSLLLNTERRKNRISLLVTPPLHAYLQNLAKTVLGPLGETLLSDAYVKPNQSNPLEMRLFASRTTVREAISAIPSSNDWIWLEFA